MVGGRGLIETCVRAPNAGGAGGQPRRGAWAGGSGQPRRASRPCASVSHWPLPPPAPTHCPTQRQSNNTLTRPRRGRRTPLVEVGGGGAGKHEKKKQRAGCVWRETRERRGTVSLRRSQSNLRLSRQFTTLSCTCGSAASISSTVPVSVYFFYFASAFDKIQCRPSHPCLPTHHLHPLTAAAAASPTGPVVAINTMSRPVTTAGGCDDAFPPCSLHPATLRDASSSPLAANTLTASRCTHSEAAVGGRAKRAATPARRGKNWGAKRPERPAANDPGINVASVSGVQEAVSRRA